MIMKHAKIALTLFCILIASMNSACSDTSADLDSKPETEATANSEAENETADTEKIPLGLPETLDFENQTIRIWYFNKSDNSAEHFYDLQGNPEGDMIEASLYDRNRYVEETLNVTLEYEDTGVGSGSVGPAIQKLMMAGDTSYDLFSVLQWNTTKLALEHCFMDVSGLPYLDLDQPWWSKEYMNAFSIGKDSCFFLAGDISLDMIRCLAAMYFNKNLLNALYDSADLIYEDVLNGTWTYDKLLTYSQSAYLDLDGDNQVSPDDRFGILTNSYNNIDAFNFGMGMKFTERDENNMPYLTLGDEHNVDIYNKIYKMVMETPSVYMNTKGNNTTHDNIQKFKSGEALFLSGFLYTSEELRDMKEDYGIIPYPKFDEKQETYYSVIHDIATPMCIPVTCVNTEPVSAALEAMAYYSYYQVTPLYYETALKTKYSRDAVSSQIIDIIHDNAATDFAYLYSAAMNDIGAIMRTLIAQKTNDYASYYAKREKSSIKSLNDLIKKYEEALQ